MTGKLSTVPTGYTDGQAVQLYANFDANIGLNDVTFYQESSVGSDDFEVAGTDEANKYGNAYLNGFVVHDGRKIFAQVAEGQHLDEATEVDTLTAQPAPRARRRQPDDDAGDLLGGQTIKLNANFPKRRLSSRSRSSRRSARHLDRGRHR